MNIVVLTYIKIASKKRGIEIEKIDEITILDKNGGNIKLNELLNKNNKNSLLYILFLEISDCPSCIIKGLEEIRKYKELGYSIAVIAIYDWLNEFISWAGNQNIAEIYMMERKKYLEHIFASYLPVLIKLKRNHKYSYRYIY